MKNKFIITSIIISNALVMPAYVLAQSSTPTSTNSATKQEKMQQRETLAKTNADKEIDRRVASLNDLVNALNAMKKISDSDKSSFISQIQTQIANLTSLKAKIDADTDLATLKTDKQSIFTQYRIYMLFIPKVRIMAAADRMGQVSDDMNALLIKIQARITEAQAKGLDTTAISALITDAQAKLTDAKAQYQNATNTVSSLTPDNGDQSKINANNQALQSARGMLKNGVTDLNATRLDIQKIRVILKGFKPSPKPTPSAT